jgi:hypothetical protein
MDFPQRQQGSGQPPYGPPLYGPPWPPQGKRNRGHGLKWAFLAVTLAAVAAIAVAATLLFTRGGSGKDSSTATAAPPSSAPGVAASFASANDKGPVSVITEDPSCAPWSPIQNTLADASKNGWTQRDPSIPADVWSDEERAQYAAVGQAFRNAANQTVPLVKLTPHRVMRELYEQFIAYARAYAGRIPTYTPPDDALARTVNNAGAVLGYICQAVEYGSAAARGPLVSQRASRTHVIPPGDPANSKRFLTIADPVCPDWKAILDQFEADIAVWEKTDPDVPASQWSPEQEATNDAVAPAMSAYAGAVEKLGDRSDNATLQDFAMLDAQYRRAYVIALPTYRVADQYLANASIDASYMVLAACAAVGGS